MLIDYIVLKKKDIYGSWIINQGLKGFSLIHKDYLKESSVTKKGSKPLKVLAYVFFFGPQGLLES